MLLENQVHKQVDLNLEGQYILFLSYWSDTFWLHYILSSGTTTKGKGPVEKWL